MKFKVVWVERENYLLIKILISHRTLFKLVKEQEADTARRIIVGEKLCDVFSPGDHGTTFAHSSMGTALGLTVLNTLLDDGLMQEAYETSLYLNGKLQDIQKENSYYIQEVRHAGMMFGISLNDTNENVKKLQVELMNKGMLVDVTKGNIIRLLPPYIITKEEIDAFMNQFIICLDKVLCCSKCLKLKLYFI